MRSPGGKGFFPWVRQVLRIGFKGTKNPSSGAISEPVNSSPEALLRDSRQKRARGIRQANRIHDARKRHSATNPDTRRAQKEGSRKKEPRRPERAAGPEGL